jgi:hypothetical protein
MTVSVADAHAHVQRLVSVVRIVTMLEYTTEEQRSVVSFLWAKGCNAKDIHKEIFPVYGGKCLSGKAVHNWVEKRGRVFADDEEVVMKVRKWLRQQSKDFCAAGFDALVKRWGRFIKVGGGYVEK